MVKGRQVCRLSKVKKMNKVLVLLFGAAIGLAEAAPALAESQVDISGFMRTTYNLDHNYMRDYDKFRDSDSYFINRLDLYLVFRPTDEVSVHWRVRAPEMQRWGNQGDEIIKANTKYVYGQITKDWGTVRVGRLDAPDQLGLTSLGYLPVSVDFWLTRLGPFDSSTDRDALWYNKSWDNGFGFTGYYTILNSQRENLNDPRPAHWDSDGNNHRFVIEPTYKWDNGGVALGAAYSIDHLQKRTHQTGTDRNYLANGGSPKMWSLSPALRLVWGGMSLNFEGQGAWGKKYRSRFLETAQGFSADPNGREDTATGMAFYINGDYKYNSGSVALGTWWANGNDIVSGGLENPTKYNGQKNRAMVDMNDNFYPFVVAYAAENRFAGRDGRFSGQTNMGGNGIWWANTQAVTNLKAAYNDFAIGRQGLPASIQTAAHANDKANNWGVSLNGNHFFNKEISMSYALGYMGLVNPNYSVGQRFVSDGSIYNVGDPTRGGQWVSHRTQSKDLGWEVDLGLKFQLLDNLSFSTTFGYMFNGDAYQTLAGYRAVGTSTPGADQTNNQDFVAVWRKPGDTYSWVSALNFNF